MKLQRSHQVQEQKARELQLEVAMLRLWLLSCSHCIAHCLVCKGEPCLCAPIMDCCHFYLFFITTCLIFPSSLEPETIILSLPKTSCRIAVGPGEYVATQPCLYSDSVINRSSEALLALCWPKEKRHSLLHSCLAVAQFHSFEKVVSLRTPR